MPKTFITERDVDDLKARGVTSIDVSNNVVMTDLAVERAFRHGIKINRVEQNALPKASFSPSVNIYASKPIERTPSVPDAETIAKVKSAVLARLDGQVDPVLLDAIITKVVSAIK